MAMDFTKAERLILINQYRVLSILDPENKDEYEFNVKILEEGFQSGYERLVDWLGDTFPDDKCHFVIETLNMFEMIARSIEENGINLPEEKRWRVQFHGFDGNNEGKYLSYTRFVIHDEERFERFNKMDLNSHSPSLDRYKRMLTKWRTLSIGEQTGPSESTILDLAKF